MSGYWHTTIPYQVEVGPLFFLPRPPHEMLENGTLPPHLIKMAKKVCKGFYKMKKKKNEEKLLKLDLGCGPNPKEGFDGADIIEFNDKVKYIVDLTKPWPWKDCSVEEVHCSHTVEHLEAMQRCHFANELYRVLIVGGKATIITPYWCSCRAYGDISHKWPPVSEFWFYYLLKEWRMGDPAKGLGANAPHTDAKYLPGGYNCDFDATWGGSLHPSLTVKNQEMQQFAMANYKESFMDLIATLTKRP